VGAIIAFAPLLLLFRLQYSWLAELEETSAIARTASLNHYLEAMANEFEYWFKTSAERVLNLPASHFTQNKMEKSAYHFRKKGVKGAKRIFVVNYAAMKSDREKLYIFDPVTWEKPASPAEVNAVLAALAPWKVMAEREVEIPTVALSVDERDPNNRIILNPITDNSRVVGVAGVILDNKFFARKMLPDAIDKFLSKLYSEDMTKDLIVTVRDHTGRLVHAPEAIKKTKKEDEAQRGFDFVYTDWTLGMRSTRLTTAQWARSNLVINLTLSGLLSVVLIGGIIVALRTVSREMRLSRMKTDFVSNVSHELRTPIASIRVFGEFFRLGRVKTSEKMMEYGEYIETESRRLTQLINNILDFSKIESGRKTYQFQDADATDVVTESLRTYQVRLTHAGFDIDFQAPEEPLPLVRLDANAMIQAVSNLLDNAVKYSRDEKSIRVKVARDDGHVVISVADKGMGISRHEQKKIFDRFHRVHTGLVHDVKGSGLGLAIVHHVVDAHGGKITVESEVGQGSTFSIHIPISKEEAAAIDSAASRRGAAGSPQRPTASSGSADAQSHA
jgi:signal transduction histidine kinase